MIRDITKELLEKGYDGSSSFNIVKTNNGKSITVSVYDADTGSFITSRNIGTGGFW